MSLLPTWEPRNPEPFEVDAYLESIEWAEEKERTRKALEIVNKQRRVVVLPRWKVLVGAWVFIGVFLGFAWAWVGPWVHRLLAKAGLL